MLLYQILAYTRHQLQRGMKNFKKFDEEIFKKEKLVDISNIFGLTIDM